MIGIQEVLRFYNTKLPLLYFGDGPNDLEFFSRIMIVYVWVMVTQNLNNMHCFKQKPVGTKGFRLHCENWACCHNSVDLPLTAVVQRGHERH